MTAINALAMTDELKETYLEKRKSIAREISNLEKDISDLEQRLKTTPSFFFSENVLPEWKKQLHKLSDELKLVTACVDTISVFNGENRDELSEVSVDSEILTRETSNVSYDEFWLDVDGFLKGERLPKNDDLEWSV